MPPRAARAPAGKSTAHVRTKVVSKSLKEIYEDQCKDRQVNVNSSVAASLPERQGAALPTDTLDMSRNYLGDNGIVPLLSVVERNPNLRIVSFVENGLRNNAIIALCAVASRHPGLRSIDVSDNCISEGAGNALIKLLEENPRITTLGIRNTRIDVELRVRIKDLLEKNNALSGGGGGGAVAAVGSAATAAHH
ncbi:Hypothetical protein, putative [Bodo saltans]|uniref:Leucine-rich repeat protein n=1 Tax=Bodo saltans TaxID=75058 RepID=A0A0S4JTE7_BODSA|nr:Hypothetical protein, putative [Bodo saltans]|eukprot:CUG93870.1 Hypothetical protein, putative [Bodo saltans]